MKFKVKYYTLGDSLVTKEVQALDIDCAIRILGNDPHDPLGQVMDVRILDDARYFYNASTGQFIQLAGLTVDNPFSQDWTEVEEAEFNQLVAQQAISKLGKVSHHDPKNCS